MKVVINNKNKYQWIFQNKTNLLFTINIFQLWSLFLLKLLYFVPEIPTFHLKFVYLSLCTSLSEKHQKSCTLYLVNFDKGTKTVYLCTWKKFQNQGHSALTYGDETVPAWKGNGEKFLSHFAGSSPVGSEPAATGETGQIRRFFN